MQALCRLRTCHALPNATKPAPNPHSLPTSLTVTEQELMCAGSVSGQLLSALAGGEAANPAEASQALFNQLAKDLLAGKCYFMHLAATQALQRGQGRAHTPQNPTCPRTCTAPVRMLPIRTLLSKSGGPAPRRDMPSVTAHL